jgi:cobalt/nickel transport protein
MRPLSFALAVLSLAAPSAGAQFNMLLPESASVKKGEAVAFIYQWGQPFEHELYDAPKPARVNVLFPDARSHKDLTGTLEVLRKPGVDGKQVAAWRFSFTPQQKGDHTFFLETPAIWLEGAKEFVQDIVRVTLHVQTQHGWDADPADGFRILPVTRPYGLLPGMIFQGEVMRKQITDVDPQIDIERYNPTPPKELPDEEFITFRTRLDSNGLFTFAFPEAGWWSFTAQRLGEGHMRNGREYPLRQRLTMWVHVGERR